MSLLTVTLAGQGLFGALLLTWLQVKRVSLDFLNDVFLQNFALKPAQGALYRFALLRMDLCQTGTHLPCGKDVIFISFYQGSARLTGSRAKYLAKVRCSGSRVTVALTENGTRWARYAARRNVPTSSQQDRRD